MILSLLQLLVNCLSKLELKIKPLIGLVPIELYRIIFESVMARNVDGSSIYL